MPSWHSPLNVLSIGHGRPARVQPRALAHAVTTTLARHGCELRVVCSGPSPSRCSFAPVLVQDVPLVVAFTLDPSPPPVDLSSALAAAHPLENIGRSSLFVPRLLPPHVPWPPPPREPALCPLLSSTIELACPPMRKRARRAVATRPPSPPRHSAINSSSPSTQSIPAASSLL